MDASQADAESGKDNTRQVGNRTAKETTTSRPALLARRTHHPCLSPPTLAQRAPTSAARRPRKLTARSPGRKPLQRSYVRAIGVAMGMISIAACGSTEDASYDIGPLFPLDADKCDRYGGEQDGDGIMASCWVTKDNCERAVADWNSRDPTFQYSC